MKKIVSLTLVTVLVLALCMPVAARYVHCRFCEDGKIMTETVRTVIGYTECPIDPSMRDPIKLVQKIESCDTCSYSKVISEYEESYCNH